MLDESTRNQGQGTRNKGYEPFAHRSVPSFFLPPCLIAILVVGAGRLAWADDAPRQVWLVSTRGASHCGQNDAALKDICYWRLDEDCDWTSADAEMFRADDDVAVPTVVFIHGNRTSAERAVRNGLFFYESIRSQAGGRPFRYVIWSWPADPVLRSNRSDARLKADWSDLESYYLAQWLDQFRPQTRVSLVGHSFGPRIITGALHLLAGGNLCDQTLSEATVAAWKAAKRNRVRTVLLAAATDADWLAPGGCHGRALSLVERALITCNGCDRVLRYYSRLYGRDGPPAMGFVGPMGVGNAPNVEVIDVSCEVGKPHDCRRYGSAPDICGRWSDYTFLEDSSPLNALENRAGIR